MNIFTSKLLGTSLPNGPPVPGDRWKTELKIMPIKAPPSVTISPSQRHRLFLCSPTLSPAPIQIAIIPATLFQFFSSFPLLHSPILLPQGFRFSSTPFCWLGFSPQVFRQEQKSGLLRPTIYIRKPPPARLNSPVPLQLRIQVADRVSRRAARRSHLLPPLSQMAPIPHAPFEQEGPQTGAVLWQLT